MKPGSILVKATDGGKPITIARHRDRIISTRLSRSGRQNQLVLNSADTIAYANALIDALEAEREIAKYDHQ